MGFDIVFSLIPFVTGGGQIIKLADIGDDIYDYFKVTVIGETMSRVKIVSQFVNATDNLYDGYKLYGVYSSFGKVGKIVAEIGGKFENALWLLDKLKEGYNIIDIGIDIGRGTGKFYNRSSSYFLERTILWIWKNRNLIKSFIHFESLD